MSGLDNKANKDYTTDTFDSNKIDNTEKNIKANQFSEPSNKSNSFFGLFRQAKPTANDDDLMIYAGMITWFGVSLPIIFDVLNGKLNLGTASWIVWIVCYFLFGTLFFIFAKGKVRNVTTPLKIAVLGVLTILVMCMQVLGGSYFLSAILFILVAALLPHVVTLRVGILWVACQSFAIAMFYYYLVKTDIPEAVIQGLVFWGFQHFALVTTNTALQETQSRQALAYANAELKAAQHFLGETSRLHERMRISRELHDLIGHHLTALSLNLEVASHLAEGRVLEQVQTSQTIAKSLLQDVREVVSNMRDTSDIDLKPVLENLVANIPSLKIELNMADNIECEADVALVVLRSVQEIISNSIKHAKAKKLWIDISIKEDNGRSKLFLQAHDDGQGTEIILEGNGLKGMQERFKELRGELSFSSTPKQGFEVEGWLPHA